MLDLDASGLGPRLLTGQLRDYPGVVPKVQTLVSWRVLSTAP